MPDISLEKLLETGAHFGHQTKRWNPKMEDFVYGVRDGVYIFDLIKTKEHLQQALDVITKASKEKKSILILGTKKQAKNKVREIAQETGIFFIDERWLGGTFTNFEQIKSSVKQLEKLEKGIEEGAYANHTKKERLLITRKIEKLNKMVGGIRGMKKLPDLFIIVDTKREKAAVREANLAKIELIGFVDTNADPTQVNWPIPVNDDSPQALDLVLDYIKDAILEGKSGKKTEKKAVETKKEKKVSKKK